MWRETASQRTLAVTFLAFGKLFKLLLTNTLFIAFVLFAVLSVSAAGAAAQGSGIQALLPGAQDTTITYQGQLRQDGQPVDGNCDFEFSLWDAASVGTRIGSMLPVNNLPVSNGLFSASLDFEVGAFYGQGETLPTRWLEVSARCPAGSGSFTSIGRQPLTPAPFARYAAKSGYALESYHTMKADSATNASNAAALEGQPGS